MTGDWTRGRRSLAAVAVFGLAATMVGCWPMPGRGSERSAHNPFEGALRADTVGDLTELWTAATDGTAPAGVGPPIVSDVDGDRRVHVSTTTGLYAFDLATGNEDWAVAPSGDRVFDTDVYFFDNGTTRLVMTSTLMGDAGTYWEVAQYIAATGSGSPVEPWGRLDGFRTTKGDPPTVVALFSTFWPNADGDLRQSFWLFLGGPGGALTDQPGEARLTLGTEQVFHAGAGLVTTEPGDGTHGNGVRAFAVEGSAADCGPVDDPRFACPQWVAPIDGTTATSPVLSADRSVVYVGTDVGTVHAVDTTTGDALWTADLGAPVAAPPALDGTTLFVPTEDGSLVALAADGCDGPTICPPLWATSEETAITVQPAVGGDVVYTGHADGSLHAFAADGCGAAECAPLWSTATGSAITGAPAVGLGRLFVGTEDGRLIAYGLS